MPKDPPIDPNLLQLIQLADRLSLEKHPMASRALALVEHFTWVTAELTTRQNLARAGDERLQKLREMQKAYREGLPADETVGTIVTRHLRPKP